MTAGAAWAAAASTVPLGGEPNRGRNAAHKSGELNRIVLHRLESPVQPTATPGRVSP